MPRVTAGTWSPPWLEDWCESVDEADIKPWFINGIIPTDAIILVSGPAKKAYKTWFAYSCARVMAAGKPSGWLEPAGNIKGEGNGANSLILAQEGLRLQTRQRWEWLAKSDGWTVPEKKVLFSFKNRMSLHDDAWLKAIRETVAANDVKLVVVDPLQKVWHGNESNPTEASAAMRALDLIREAGRDTSLMYIHHLRKPSGEATDIDEDVRGSSVWAGAYDVHIAFRPIENGIMLITVRCRDAEEKQYVGSWKIDENNGTAKFTLEGITDED